VITARRSRRIDLIGDFLAEGLVVGVDEFFADNVFGTGLLEIGERQGGEDIERHVGEARLRALEDRLDIGSSSGGDEEAGFEVTGAHGAGEVHNDIGKFVSGTAGHFALFALFAPFGAVAAATAVRGGRRFGGVLCGRFALGAMGGGGQLLGEAGHEDKFHRRPRGHRREHKRRDNREP